jgi:hypothetical protein
MTGRQGEDESETLLSILSVREQRPSQDISMLSVPDIAI